MTGPAFRPTLDAAPKDHLPWSRDAQTQGVSALVLVPTSLAPQRPLSQVARPGLREKIRGIPNFRDHGKTVDAGLLRLLCRLQRRHGVAWFAEAGARKMLCEDVGHMPGVGTIPAALARLEASGLLTRDWCTRGSIMPDGSVASEGCVLVTVPQARIEPRIARAMAGRTRQERIVRGRIHPQRIHELRARMGTIAPRPARVDVETFEDKRRRALDLAAAWDAKDRGPPK